MAATPSVASPNTPGINRIAISGFKSLSTETDVEIRPLTVLAGANSSGKSSLMQPLLLMKQTLESDVNPAGPFLLTGPYTRYTETRQFLTRGGQPDGAPRPLTLEFGFDEGLAAGMSYSVDGELGLSVAETWGLDATKQTRWRITKAMLPGELRALLLELGSVPLVMEHAGLTEQTVQSYQFYQSVLFSAPESLNSMRRELYFMNENLKLNSQIRRVIYVPGLRGDQNRKWLLADVNWQGFFEGPFESYVPSLIDSWRSSGEDSKWLALTKGLIALDLASGIKTVRINESEIEVHIPRTLNCADNDFVNIADVGLAVSTALPVLAAMINAGPGQLVYIEQPELHLHPRAQWRLAQLLAEAANRGVRLVIETHSSLLLRGILTQVAENKIASDNVILHWFERNPETGLSTVRSNEPDSAGRVGDWPEDFSEVEMKSDSEYLDAVEKKLYAQAK